MLMIGVISISLITVYSTKKREKNETHQNVVACNAWCTWAFNVRNKFSRPFLFVVRRLLFLSSLLYRSFSFYHLIESWNNYREYPVHDMFQIFVAAIILNLFDTISSVGSDAFSFNIFSFAFLKWEKMNELFL